MLKDKIIPYFFQSWQENATIEMNNHDKQRTQEIIKNNCLRNRVTDVENKLTVTRGKGGDKLGD